MAGEGLLEQQHLPGPNTYLQALLVSKPVPNSPLRDPVLAIVVLEGPKSSDHPSHSYQQPVSGQELGGAPSSTSQGWDAGLFPWEPSNTASLQACSPAGTESGRGSPARAGWLAAGLVPLSSQSLSQSQHKMPLARKMLQKQQLGGLWEHFSQGGCLVAARSWHSTLPRAPCPCNMLFIKQEHLD